MNYMVDVIIPTYKRSDMLERAVNSILEQTYKNVKVIVVDDNNPYTEWRRETKEIMKKYDNDTRVLYICHEKNKNGSAARNTGLKYGNGDFVCFLDDDDYFLKNKVEKQIKYLLKESTKDACYCDYIKNGKNIKLADKSDFTYDILLGLPTPQTSGIMFRRSVIDRLDGFDVTYYRHQDYELLLRFYDNFSMGKIDEVLYVRERSDIDNNPDGIKLEKLKKKFLSEFRYKLMKIEKKECGYINKVLVYNYIDVMKSYIKQKDFKNTLRILSKTFKINVSLTMNILMKNFLMHKSNKK